MKRKKAMAIVMVAAMTVTMLAGCGSSASDTAVTPAADSAATDTRADSTADTSADSGEVITLRVVDWESDEMNAAMQDAFDNVFSVAHPNIKVEIVEGSYSDYSQQMNAMITAGEAPDVFQLGYDQGCSFYKKNLLTDWTDKAAADSEFMDGFYEGTVDGWQYDGKTYGLPGLVNVYGIFYNKDILANAGLDEPSADWTWDDLFEYAEKLKDPSSNKFGLYGLNTDIFGLTNISVSEGGSPFVDSLTHTTKVTVDDKLKEAAEKVAGLIADGTIPGRTYETANQLSAFEAGEMGMLFYGQWEVDSLIRNCPDLNWGYAPIPKGSVKAAESYDTVGWVSPKDLKYPDETWELMKFMSSEMYETVLTKTPVAACAHAASADVFYNTVKDNGHEDAAEAVKTMMAIETKNAIRYAADWSGDAGKLWDPDFNNFMDGKSGTVDTLTDLAQKVNDLIAAQ